MRAPAAWALGALLVLSGCSVDPRDEIRGQVEDITLDANGRDAGAVRAGVADLLQTVEQAVRDGDLTRAEADTITALAVRVRDAAGLLEPPTPTPTPSATSASPAPTTTSPTPEPTPSQEPTPSAEPEPSEEPAPSETPAPTEPPLVVEPTLSPAAAQQPVATATP